MSRTFVIARVLVGMAVGVALASTAQGQDAPDPPTRSYYVYVCAESDDEVALVRLGPTGLEVVKTIAVGSHPTEIEGPHGIRVGPDGRYWYVSIAHGFPFGTVERYETGTDAWVGRATVGLFPATLDLSPITGLLYVVNFDLHGPPEPSTVSVIEIDTMTEVARVESGLRPHGARLSADGTTLYVVNVMGNELVEIDALGLEVTRRLALGDGVQPSWVTAPTRDGRVFVTGQSVGRIYEVDIADWRVRRSFESGPGPYNLALTPDEATLVVTYKGGDAVGFWDVASGTERARVETSRTLPHGVVVTPDGQYAIVTLEGVGSEPGTVEAYHIPTAERVGVVDVGKQAGGIALWPTDDTARLANPPGDR